MCNIPYKFVLVFFLFLNFLSAQEVKIKEVKIYNSLDGIKKINPKTILEVYKTKTLVFKTVNGIKELIPIKIIENNKVFIVKDGFPDIMPVEEFEVEWENNL